MRFGGLIPLCGQLSFVLFPFVLEEYTMSYRSGKIVIAEPSSLVLFIGLTIKRIIVLKISM